MKKIILGIFAFIFLILAFFSLTTFKTILNLKTNSQAFIENSFTGKNSEENYNQKIIKDLEKINNKIKKISFLSPETLYLSETVNILAQEFLKEDINYLIILQNSDELRATGGFMGSYSRYSIKNGLISELKIEDIYTPSGQYQGFQESPPGLNEYLSAGEGMKLPDANWYPDLPESATKIINFFEEIENKKYDGVIFINLNLIEKILNHTGEIYLPDYKTNINSNNFSTLAREGRENFFPGSQEKSNFLNASLKAIQLELEKLIKENPQKILTIIQEAITEKDAIVYWEAPKTWREFWQKTKSFSKGDVEGKVFRKKVLLIFFRYFLGLSLILINWPLAVLSLLAYVVWAISKNYQNCPNSWYLLPLLQIVSDLAVMTGVIAALR